MVVGFQDKNGFQYSILLVSLVAGHTKNSFDVAFGFLKNKLKRRNFMSPLELMRILEDISDSNNIICSIQVSWRDWKRFLSKFFTMFSSFRITQYHFFAFDEHRPGIAQVKYLTITECYLEFNLLKNFVDIQVLRSE